jgi:hypothetical protein
MLFVYGPIDYCIIYIVGQIQKIENKEEKDKEKW